MEPKFRQLHPRLFVRGHTRHVATETIVSGLVQRHIQFVLNVALISDNPLRDALRLIGIAYRHEQLSDSRQVDKDKVLRLAGDVADHMHDAGVLVHCDSGHNRSNLVAILGLAMYTGAPITELLKQARDLQPLTLKNKAFETFVLAQDGRQL